jgi:hypothetical protein
MASAFHTFGIWFVDIFLPAWKVISIAVAGAFGALGLITDFKRKVRDPETDTVKQKITTWGWTSLIGIVLSTMLGMAAQMKDAVDARSDAEETRKSLAPLDEPKLGVMLTLPCDDTVWYHEECDVQAARLAINGIKPPPGLFFGNMAVIVNLFRNEQEGLHSISDQSNRSDLYLQFFGKVVDFMERSGELTLYATNMPLAQRAIPRPGGIFSALEIPGATAIVHAHAAMPIKTLRVRGFGITLKNGMQYRAAPTGVTTVSFGDVFSELRFAKDTLSKSTTPQSNGP